MSDFNILFSFLSDKHKRRYLIFYCPLNLFYKCVAFLPIKLVLVALKEVVRTRKIAAGVHHAHHAYHHGFFIMVIVGYVKGTERRVFSCRCKCNK